MSSARANQANNLSQLFSFKHNNAHPNSNQKNNKAFSSNKYKSQLNIPFLTMNKTRPLPSMKTKTQSFSTKKSKNSKDKSRSQVETYLKSRISPETLTKKTSLSFKSLKPSKKSTIRKTKIPSSITHRISSHLANQQSPLLSLA